MPFVRSKFTRCYVDESIHSSLGVVVTAMVFADSDFEGKVLEVLLAAGLKPPAEEYKSSARMDMDPRMSEARASLLRLTNLGAKVAIVVGPFYRPSLGRQVMQALQSVIVRNAIDCEGLEVFIDREVFASQKEALRLRHLFVSLHGVAVHAHQDSKLRLGIQAADAIAHSFGQIIKESMLDTPKAIDIGREHEGYPAGTMAPLGWKLLVSLRNALMTRPVVCGAQDYPVECDPAVLDPERDDPVAFSQQPVLLGWGLQVAPESGPELRIRVEEALGTVWLGCIH